MGFLSSMNINASGMTAQRLRLDIASENITNIDTTRTENGGAYRRKMVVFQSMEQSNFRSIYDRVYNRGNKGPGVIVSQVVEDPSELRPVYNPEHPDANEEGYVMMPNVDLVKETVDAMAAYRAYEANVNAFNVVKAMANKALDIGRN